MTLSEVRNQCSFIECPADHLERIADGSVDALFTRAIIGHVADKACAFEEFFRVLKPGARLTICEPILRDEALDVTTWTRLIDAQPSESRDRLAALHFRIIAAQLTAAMEPIPRNITSDVDERALLHFAEDAGFTDIQMEFHADTHRSSMTNWEAFLDSSPHPLSPLLGEVIAGNLSETDRQYFEEACRSAVEAGRSTAMTKVMYLTARKPSSPP